jgi:hypothetical protein
MHIGQFVREKKELRLPGAAAVGRVVNHQVHLLVTGLAARLDLVFANLPHEEAVLLEILADYAFVDG